MAEKSQPPVPFIAYEAEQCYAITVTQLFHFDPILNRVMRRARPGGRKSQPDNEPGARRAPKAVQVT
jgi:hypothetical protein